MISAERPSEATAPGLSPEKKAGTYIPAKGLDECKVGPSRIPRKGMRDGPTHYTVLNSHEHIGAKTLFM